MHSNSKFIRSATLHAKQLLQTPIMKTAILTIAVLVLIGIVAYRLSTVLWFLPSSKFFSFNMYTGNASQRSTPKKSDLDDYPSPHIDRAKFSELYTRARTLVKMDILARNSSSLAKARVAETEVQPQNLIPYELSMLHTLIEGIVVRSCPNINYTEFVKMEDFIGHTLQSRNNSRKVSDVFLSMYTDMTTCIKIWDGDLKVAPTKMLAITTKPETKASKLETGTELSTSTESVHNAILNAVKIVEQHSDASQNSKGNGSKPSPDADKTLRMALSYLNLMRASRQSDNAHSDLLEQYRQALLKLAQYTEDSQAQPTKRKPRSPNNHHIDRYHKSLWSHSIQNHSRSLGHTKYGKTKQMYSMFEMASYLFQKTISTMIDITYETCGTQFSVRRDQSKMVADDTLYWIRLDRSGFMEAYNRYLKDLSLFQQILQCEADVKKKHHV